MKEHDRSLMILNEVLMNLRHNFRDKQ